MIEQPVIDFMLKMFLRFVFPVSFDVFFYFSSEFFFGLNIFCRIGGFEKLFVYFSLFNILIFISGISIFLFSVTFLKPFNMLVNHFIGYADLIILYFLF